MIPNNDLKIAYEGLMRFARKLEVIRDMKSGLKYDRDPVNKAKRKTDRKKPKNIESIRKYGSQYHKRPYVMRKAKEKRDTEEFKKKASIYNAEYYQRPGVKEKRKTRLEKTPSLNI